MKRITVLVVVSALLGVLAARCERGDMAGLPTRNVAPSRTGLEPHGHRASAVASRAAPNGRLVLDAGNVSVRSPTTSTDRAAVDRSYGDRPGAPVASAANTGDVTTKLVALLKARLRGHGLECDPDAICDDRSCAVTFPTGPCAADEDSALQAIETWTLAQEGEVGPGVPDDAGVRHMTVTLIGLAPL